MTAAFPTPTAGQTSGKVLSPELMASWIKQRASELGFDVCGITNANPAARADYLKQWLDEGRAGEMAWLAREPERRADPRVVLPDAQSIVIVGLNSWQEPLPGRARVARYALGDDYHDIMTPRLQQLADELERKIQPHLAEQIAVRPQPPVEMPAGKSRSGKQRPPPSAFARVYVDTGPVLERPLAERAGLGWQGKSTMLISTRFGPWLMLGEIITTVALPPDKAGTDRCGKCTRCIDKCPTGAITGPYQLDARRCIAYLTIENKGAIPEEFRPLIGNRLYGCEECLEVCPWNRFAQQTREDRMLLRPSPDAAAAWDPRALLSITPAEFKQRFAGSPVLRIKRRGLLRNACVVLGNIGTAEDLPALQAAAMSDAEPLVREHAAWAVTRINMRLESHNTGVSSK
ncbi:MAG: tRNA epoxyqueuosine(34) reductase QueG [Candidatus Methylacidiphilales bacterium]